MTNTPKPEALKGCPFCNAELEKPSPVKFPKSGLARMHPGTTDDGSCPIAGWGFYDEQLANWNTRASDTTITTLAAERDALKADDLLEWFGTRYGLELSFSGWDDENEWQVHIVNGGRNDREWTLIGSGQSPAEAITAARTTLERTAQP